MIYDPDVQARNVAKINAFWRKLGVNAEAHVTRSGEIASRLTSGLPPVRLSETALLHAIRASGAFSERGSQACPTQ